MSRRARGARRARGRAAPCRSGRGSWRPAKPPGRRGGCPAWSRGTRRRPGLGQRLAFGRTARVRVLDDDASRPGELTGERRRRRGVEDVVVAELLPLERRGRRGEGPVRLPRAGSSIARGGLVGVLAV